MKYAIVGMGFIYPRHEKSIKETGGEIILTCDIDPIKQADFTNWEEMFESPKFNEVDTVVICTPNYLHAPMARKALSKGKKVLCEKPLSINGVDGLDGVNVVLQLRLNSKVEELRKLDKADISIIVKTYREPKYFDSWKGQTEKSGGILYNMGIHYIDLLQYLLGEKYEILESKITKYLAKGRIKFPKGIGTYHIELLTEPAPIIRKIIVNGEKMDLEGATIPLSDTGQYTNLHTGVYREFIQGKGMGLQEAKKSLELVNNLLKFSEKN